MRTTAPVIGDRVHPATVEEELDARRKEQFEDELIMDLERDQFVAETSQPVQPAPLSARAGAALWALRVFVILVGLMVIYTFIDQLH
ncbi:MAG: hypothetical protein ACHP93_05915 [Solirubrobacterales bacterium]